jgi:hypothetical protein
MSTGGVLVGPARVGWVAMVYGARDEFTPLGAGVAIGRRRVLTCAHVVRARHEAGAALWVAFPMSEDPHASQRSVARVRMDARPEVDLAVLELAEELPPDVEPAELRCPRPADLRGKQWWAFGFADHDPRGNSADGSVGEALAFGWVRLDAGSRYLVRPGFSGTGLWSPDYQAVVGIVGQAHDQTGDGQAVTLWQADRSLPEEKLRRLAEWSAATAGEVALASWGWSLDRDPEGVRHWRPRARGVSSDAQRGYRFQGREAALTKIVQWLDPHRAGPAALIVTGSPGVGKSAVLGRIVTTADPGVRAALPATDIAVQAPERSVSCAVHAKGKTALDVATEIARAASAALPASVRDFAAAVQEELAELRFTVVIDALDEATTPAEARAIVRDVVLPLTGIRGGRTQVAVGTRRRDDAGDLVGLFGTTADVIDLDDRRYFSPDDLAAYAKATLQQLGDPRTGNPYTDDAVAAPVARRIAELADRNFLVAGLIAHAHGRYDTDPTSPDQVTFIPTVDDPLRRLLDRIPPVAGVSAVTLLTALAYAETPGWTTELWLAAVTAITGDLLSEPELAHFARSSAANFLVEAGRDSVVPTFRLFHQALNDALLRARAGMTTARQDQAAITRAFHGLGGARGWHAAPDYLVRSLGHHAAAGGSSTSCWLTRTTSATPTSAVSPSPPTQPPRPKAAAAPGCCNSHPRQFRPRRRSAQPCSASPRPWRASERASGTTAGSRCLLIKPLGR